MRTIWRIWVVVAVSWLCSAFCFNCTFTTAEDPVSVRLTLDIPYADTDNPRQRLDLIVPEALESEPLPVIVFIHGGAWQRGDKRWGLDRVIDYVGSKKFVAVLVAYRLSGEIPWPAQIHDCKAAIRWVRSSSDRLGLDSERIGVWGDSAGGHLAAMLGTSGDVAAMDGSVGPHRAESRVSSIFMVRQTFCR